MAMSFSSLFKKASNFLGLGTDNLKPPPLDGEIIYCKNNVCVYPPTALSNQEPVPGYLNVRSQDDEVLGSTLILTWIPNSTLKKNPRSLESSPSRGKSPRLSPRRARPEYSKKEYSSRSPSLSPDDGMFVDQTGRLAISAQHVVGEAENSDTGMDKPVENSGAKDNILGNGEDNAQKAEGPSIVTKPSIKVESTDSPGRPAWDPTAVSTSESSPSSDGSTVCNQDKLLRLLTGGSSTDGSEAGNVWSGTNVSIEMDGDNIRVVTDSASSETTEQHQHKELVPSPERTETSVNNTTGHVDNGSEGNTGNISAITEHSVKDNGSTHTDTRQGDDSLKVNKESKKKPADLALDLKDTSQTGMASDRPGTPVSASSSSTSTSGPDSQPPTPPSGSDISPGPSPLESPNGSERHSSFSSEGFHNMTFPDNSVVYSDVAAGGGKCAKDQVCGVFSVDLGQMRSVRMFYTDDNCSSGQLVIASRESQYKILHFHHGGLDRLEEVFCDWKFFAQKTEKGRHHKDKHLRYFSVIRPYLPHDQCHPEESAYAMVDLNTWKQHMNEDGVIQDDFHLRKAIFFAGLDAAVRHEMWPFLLHYYPYSSTFDEREQIRNDKYIEYQNLRKQRESMTEEEQGHFWKTIQCTVEKDVVRTDRSHPYFRGHDNPNIEILQNILLNYAVAHPHLGYSQGMSDLLAPVLAELQNEVDAYWCFVGLMQKTIFISSPKDMDMDLQLTYLKELLRIMKPRFYRHLKKVQDGLDLLFCHRWILLCFKREFQEEEALRIWEACWAHYQTDYFHLFLCVAIISVYGEDVVQQDLPADEMLLHFSSLSMHMNAHVVLKKARGLLHRFRLRPKIPCTLDGLCALCGHGIWDSGHVPTVVCECKQPSCPYGGQVPVDQPKGS